MNNSRLFLRFCGTALLPWQLNCLLLGANTCVPRLATRFCQLWWEAEAQSPLCSTQTSLCCDWKLKSWSQVSLSRVELPLVQVKPFSNASVLNDLTENTTANACKNRKILNYQKSLGLSGCFLFSFSYLELYFNCSWPVLFLPNFSAGNCHGKAHSTELNGNGDWMGILVWVWRL